MSGNPGVRRPRGPQRSQDAKTATTWDWGRAAKARQRTRLRLLRPNPGRTPIGSAAFSIRALDAEQAFVSSRARRRSKLTHAISTLRGRLAPRASMVGGCRERGLHPATARGTCVQEAGQGRRGLLLAHAGARAGAGGNVRSIAAMVAATALFTCGDAAMKLVSANLPTGETICVRGFSSLAIVTVAAFWTGAIYRLKDALVRGMGWRSVGDVGSAVFFQAALARMPFADLMGILQITPLSLTAASALFLGERVGWRRWTAVAVGCAGAVLVIKPGSSAFNAWALLGLLSVLSGTVRDVATRRLDVALSPLLIMALSQLAVASAGLSCWAFETWQIPTSSELLALVFASVFSLTGHLCVISSLRSGEVAAVAPFRYAGIVWAILIGYAIWRQLPDGLSLAGILILVSAGLYTFYREQKLRRLARAHPR